MNDNEKADRKVQELDEKTLDQASGGQAPRPGSPARDGNVAGLDDWEKHNV